MRRRYVFPAEDLASPRARISSVLDNMSAALLRKQPHFDLAAMDPTRSVVVLGFPRSGNTFLHSWLSSMVHTDISVLDGRLTHSALDLLRLGSAQKNVVVPVREPLDACASMMVRTGAHDCLRHGSNMLKAYRAWYGVALPSARMRSVSVVAFEEFTGDPVGAICGTPVEPLLDEAALLSYEKNWFMQRLSEELAGVPGQGLPQDGVPAHHMISIPHAGRTEALEVARSLLLDPRLAREREGANLAYARFVEASGVGVSEPAWQLPEQADRQAAGSGREEGVRVGE